MQRLLAQGHLSLTSKSEFYTWVLIITRKINTYTIERHKTAEFDDWSIRCLIKFLNEQKKKKGDT